MKTIKLTRTIRREVGGMFVYIGPKGIAFRKKHSKHNFPITWKCAWTQALLIAAAEEEKDLKPILEVKLIPEDPRQMLMFTDLGLPLPPSCPAQGAFMESEPVNVPEAEQMPVFPQPMLLPITPETVADAYVESIKKVGDPIGTASRSIADAYVDAYEDTLGPSGTFNEDPPLDEPEALRIAERVNKALDEEVNREG